MKFRKERNWYYVNGVPVTAKALHVIFSELLSESSWEKISVALHNAGEVNLNLGQREVFPDFSVAREAKTSYTEELEAERKKSRLLEDKILELMIRNIYLEDKVYPKNCA